MGPKRLIILAICLLTLRANAQQKINVFHITDQVTNKPVPFVSVTILGAGLFINTEKDGMFIIPGDIVTMRDTIAFAAQNYSSLKMPLSALSFTSTIRLTKNEVTAPGITQKYTTETLLNDFVKNDIGHFAGFDTETSLFDYYQLAQQFETPKAGARLKRVKIARLAFDDRWEGWERATYRLRFYDVDAITQGPGRELTNKTIEISNGEIRESGIGLTKYNIIAPHQTFFCSCRMVAKPQ